MTARINKIHLVNFKRFKDYTIQPNNDINVLIGDNETGKSTVLEAIDLVLSGSVHRVEATGLDKLLNMHVVDEFLSRTDKTISSLPKLIVELYLTGDFHFSMNGDNNEDKIRCDGIRLVCEPNIDFSSEIQSSITSSADYFPYDYYSIRFLTFAGEGYSGHKRKVNSIVIDSTNMSSDYATNDFVKRMYKSCINNDPQENARYRSTYRNMKVKYRNESLKTLNEKLDKSKGLSFGLKNGSSVNFENDLMIYEQNISIDSRGTGKQIMIKTDFALNHATNADVILFEEPENHLSGTKLRQLVSGVAKYTSKQLFIATHSSYICSRLDLKNLIILHIDNESPIMLKDLSCDTAAYFVKAPAVGIAEFVLSPKVILVEGPSEYMLFEKFYETVTGNKPEADNVSVISIRGLSFKRYLEVAKFTKGKVAVVTDNDGNKQQNCLKKYQEYDEIENIGVFYEEDNTKTTFEKVLYADNQDLCEKKFSGDACDYMLNNKTESAYELLSSNEPIKVPLYIEKAIRWIRE